MADLELNRQNIENLAQKVASLLWPELSDPERELLRAIFANAAHNASPPGLNQPATLPAASNLAPPLPAGADQDATLANIQAQLLTAYTPGNSFDSVTEGGNVGKVLGQAVSRTRRPLSLKPKMVNTLNSLIAPERCYSRIGA